MERKQDNLLPIGEALAGLDGPVKALAKSSPQARHHFTQADQVNQLGFRASEDGPRPAASWRGSWCCALCRAPTPATSLQYKRVNGPFTLIHVRQAVRNKLPFGNLAAPDCWPGCATEAVRTQSRVLVLGSVALRLHAVSWAWSTAAVGGKARTRLRNQMKRLFGCPRFR